MQHSEEKASLPGEPGESVELNLSDVKPESGKSRPQRKLYRTVEDYPLKHEPSRRSRRDVD